MESSKRDIDQIISALNSNSDGLTQKEAESRLGSYGYNEIIEKKPKKYFKFLSKFWAPVPWMLEITAALTYILGKYIDTYVILFLLIFNSIVGYSQESKANDAVELLKSKLHVGAKVERDGEWKLVEARYLVPGDIIYMKLGDVVPADSVLISGQIEVDQSALTGESIASIKSQGDICYSGSILKRGEAVGIVEKTGPRTYFGRTTVLVQVAGAKSHIEEIILGVIRYLIMIDLSLVALMVVFSFFFNIGIASVLPFALVVVITSIPVALPATFTIAMAIGALDLSKKGAIVTKLTAIEDAASMEVLCSDKTGTITENRLTVSTPVTFNSTPQKLMEYAAYASEIQTDDALDKAVFNYVNSHGITADITRRISFSPFDPSNKRTEAIILENGNKVRIVKGAPQVIAGLCNLDYEELSDKVVDFAKRGYRVIAVGAGQERLVLQGLIPLYDPPRKDSGKLIAEMKELGIEVKIATGDNGAIAEQIAEQVGIKGISCNVHGPDEYDVDKCSIFAEVFPEDKFNIVKKFQEKKKIVGMTGDGVNDAPALKQAEVGIAVSNATDIAKASASVVLTHEGISDIVEAVKEGRRIYQRMFTYTINKIIKTLQVVVFLTLSFFAVRFFVTTSLDIILLLFANDFVTMSIATDMVRYSKNPEKWNLRGMVVSSGMLSSMLVVEGLVVLYGSLYFHLSIDEIQTVIFDMFVFSGVFTVLMVRERGRFWHSRPSKALATALVADVLFVSLFSFLGILVTRVPLDSILMVLGIAFAWMVLMDLVKNYIFRYYKL